MNDILKALGIEKLPPGISEFEFTAKIVRDPVLTTKSRELVITTFTAIAINKMKPVEKSELLKRVMPQAAPNRVTWGIAISDRNQQLHITARGQNADMFFAGRPEKAYEFAFMGETCPVEVADEYRRLYKPVGFAQDGVIATLSQQEAPYHASIEKGGK